MDSNNEKAIRQSQTSAARPEAGSQALEAQENRQGEAIAQNATSSETTQSTPNTAKGDNGHREEVVVDAAQDVVSQFLSKGESNAAEYIELIEDMLGDYSKYHWAESTLLGIYDFIEKEGYITEKQMEAVDNIQQSRQ